MHQDAGNCGIKKAVAQALRLLGQSLRRQWVVWSVTTLAVIVLLVVGMWTRAYVRNAIRRTLAGSLETILEADVTALKIWIDNQVEFVSTWATQEHFRQSTHQLINQATGNDPTRQLQESESLRGLLERVPKIFSDDDYGFLLIGRTGMILASDRTEAVGGTILSQHSAILADTFSGNGTLLHPFSREHSQGKYLKRNERAMMGVAAPVFSDSDEVIAALVILLDPEQEFTRILSVGRVGETGTTYAFNRNGLLISDYQFEDDMRQSGLLPADARGILTVEIRDPGGDVTQGYRPTLPVKSLPLTRVAAYAIQSGGTGVVDAVYRDPRGVPVHGAWHWLDDYGFGVVTEVAEADIEATLSPIQIAFGGLAAVLAGVMAVAVIKTAVAAHLRGRIRTIEQVGQYTLIRKIGTGGMGEVYEARHALLRRPTAVKLLRGPNATPETVARFEREVQLTCQLTHPNTIEIYDFGRTPQGVFFYAMEYLEGLTLDQAVAINGTMPWPRVVHILAGACASLEEAHDAGLIHRDIKPMNIMLCSRGGRFDAVKVLDFGLVKDIFTPEQVRITAPDIVAGTPAYIAPERARDPLHVDGRTDIYALGAVGFLLLTGREIFEGISPMQILDKALAEPSPRIRDCVETPVPDELDRLITDCLEKDPANRPQTARVVSEILADIGKQQPWTRDDAACWWQQHEERIQEVCPSPSPGWKERGAEDRAVDVTWDSSMQQRTHSQ